MSEDQTMLLLARKFMRHFTFTVGADDKGRPVLRIDVDTDKKGGFWRYVETKDVDSWGADGYRFDQYLKVDEPKKKERLGAYALRGKR